MTASPHLDNAVTRSEQSADFDVAPRAERAGLEPGDFAKVACQGERFWLRVESNDCGRYVGTVANMLFCEDRHGLQVGARVAFDADHVFDAARQGMEGSR